MRIDPVPVMVRGQLFPSMTACAKHFGVGIGHVTDMLDRGTLDNIGKGRNFDRKLPMAIDGKPFESVAAAAQRIGISPQNLATQCRRAIAAGKDGIVTPYGRITWGQAHD